MGQNQRMSLRSPALRRDWFRVMPVEEGHRVTTLELFFDLVYVFAFTQVTAWIAHEHSWHGTAQGLLVLGLLWWTWVAWSWTGNVVRADKGVPLLGFTASMVAIFVVALTIRSVWEAEAGELAAVAFALAYLALRVVHAGVYLWSARGDATLMRQVAISAAAWIPAAGLLVIGAFLPPEQRLWWWAGTLTIDLTATWILAVRGDGWQVRSGGHFAERYGLIVILALGESVVAVGVAAENIELSGTLIVIAALGVLAALALWWPYFKDISPTLEEAIEEATPAGKVDIARDSYTYMHLPLVAGVIVAAAGVEEAVVTLTEHHTAGVAAALLAGGAALFSASGAILMALVKGEWRYLAASAVFFAAAAFWMQPLDAILVLAITTAVLTVVGIVTPASRTQQPLAVETE